MKYKKIHNIRSQNQNQSDVRFNFEKKRYEQYGAGGIWIGLRVPKKIEDICTGIYFCTTEKSWYWTYS